MGLHFSYPFFCFYAIVICEKKLPYHFEQGLLFGAAERHHFLKRAYRYLQLWLAMLCSYLAGSHRESNQMLLASAYASCLPSCVHMQLFSHLPRIASPPSRGLLLHLHIPFRPGQPCKAVAAIGAVLAPSERQQFSLFFRTAYYFFGRRAKKWTQFGCHIPAPKWGRFLALFHLLVLNNESRSHFGSGIWPQNGSAFLSQRCKKMQPRVPRNDHHC